VNGVINIITKSAKATEGGLISAGGGSKEAAEGLVQYGGKIGNSGAFRAFGRYSNIGGSANASGLQSDDARRMSHGGFRSDWDLSRRDALTVQGDFLQSQGGETLTAVTGLTPPLMGTFHDPIRDYSGNLLARWTRTYSNGSDTSLQVYDDKSRLAADGVHDGVNIVDVDFEHHLSLGSRHDLVWGLNFRSATNRFEGQDLLTLNPLRRTDQLFSAFLQDEITLTHSLSLTLGSKFEHNAYTGYEDEPSAQLVWTPTARQTVWASAAKAIRQPSNIDAGIEVVGSLIPLGPAGVGAATVFGNPNIKVEELHDFEAGYRAQLSRRLSLDLTAFRSYYKHLETNEPRTPFFTFTPAPHLVIPLVYDNLAHARDFGAELFANWNVTEHWKVSPGLSLLKMSVTRNATSQDATIESTPGYSPERQFQVRSFLNLPHSLEWDHTVGYTGRLSNGDVPGYMRLDTRFAWRIGESLEVSVVGQNLLQPKHAEFPDIHYVNHMQDQRSFFGKITWRF
jgi:iron complex outermembrane receptor protein